MSEQYSEAFCLVADLAAKVGVNPISQFPGCWEVPLGDGFWIAVNGHGHAVTCDPPDHPKGSQYPTVPPYTMYVQRNGWPAAFVDPLGGTVLGTDTEDGLIEAIKRAIESGVPA